ncbi:MAG TPA: haloacid dehalogenase, partial [Thermodesulfobacteriota bacterium]|nr:haloacid dehalogenase [Thermodesulfobacteriota bacterium]
VAFDIDGVFGNVMELFIRLAREIYQIDSIHYGDITRYYLYDCLDLDAKIIDRLIEKIVDYPYALEMNPFDQAVPVLSAYGQRYPLTFITARQKAEPVTDWVLGRLPDVDPQRIQVIATGQHHLKLDILQALGFAYYIDDHLDTCHLLYQHEILPIVFEQPWNQEPHPFPRVANWGELGKILLAHPG